MARKPHLPVILQNGKSSKTWYSPSVSLLLKTFRKFLIFPVRIQEKLEVQLSALKTLWTTLCFTSQHSIYLYFCDQVDAKFPRHFPAVFVDSWRKENMSFIKQGDYSFIRIYWPSIGLVTMPVTPPTTPWNHNKNPFNSLLTKWLLSSP